MNNTYAWLRDSLIIEYSFEWDNYLDTSWLANNAINSNCINNNWMCEFNWSEFVQSPDISNYFNFDFTLSIKFNPRNYPTSGDYDIIYRWSDNQWYDISRLYYSWYDDFPVLLIGNSSINLTFFTEMLQDWWINRFYNIIIKYNSSDWLVDVYADVDDYITHRGTYSVDSNISYPNDYYLSIGNRFYNPNEWFDWFIDDVRLHNTAINITNDYFNLITQEDAIDNSNCTTTYSSLGTYSYNPIDWNSFNFQKIISDNEIILK